MWEINKNVIFVSGAKNGAVYDLNTGSVFSVNDVAKSVILEYVVGRKQPSDGVASRYLQQLKTSSLYADDFSPRPFFFPPARPPKLSFAWLELTEKCNLKCVHCYEGNEHRKSEQEMSVDRWKRVMRELSECGCSSVQFIGGEPCCAGGLYESVRYAADLFREITVFTNASLLTSQLMNLFAEKSVKVRFSLYGHTKEVHEAVTQVVGSFDKTVENVKKMLALGLSVSPSVIIMRQNEKYIGEIKKFIEDLGMKYKPYDVIRDVYGGTQSAFRPVGEEAITASYRTAPSFRADKERFLSAPHINTCWAGKMAITSDGKVLPCIFERDAVIGNVCKQSVSEILSSEPLKRAWGLDFSQVEQCEECEFRFACKDCRPLGKSRSGNMYAKNPRCLYNPRTGIWAKVPLPDGTDLPKERK